MIFMYLESTLFNDLFPKIRIGLVSIRCRNNNKSRGIMAIGESSKLSHFILDFDIETSKK